MAERDICEVLSVYIDGDGDNRLVSIAPAVLRRVVAEITALRAQEPLAPEITETVKHLRALSRAEHSDLSVAGDGADLIEALATCKERLQVGWQDISTAPKDGTWILLRGRNAIGALMVPVVAAWRPVGSRANGWADSGSFKSVDDLAADEGADWMPLPAGPLSAPAPQGEK